MSINDTTVSNHRRVFIDDIAPAGSAFGATDSGEAVFINARIVQTVKIKGGDFVKAWLMPNYEDKRDKVPWRVVRAEVIGSAFSDISSEPEDETPLEPEVTQSDMVLNLLSEHGPMRTATLARAMKANSGEVGTLCHGLFAKTKIAMADVYSDPANKRSSHRVWAIDINDFDVDPDDTDQA